MRQNKIVCKTNEQWRQERSKSIGASAVGIILGESHFATPIDLQAKMKAELQGEFSYEETPAMVRGHAYESGVAYQFEYYQKKRIIKDTAKEYILRRNDIPFLHASPDRLYWIDDTKPHSEANKGVLECKTTTMPVDPNELPISWEVQLQIQMGIGGYHEGYIAWDQLSIANGYGCKRYEFDPEMFKAAVEVCKHFWEHYIIGDETPDPVSTSDIVRLYPISDPSKTITANNTLANQLLEIKTLAETKRELETIIDNKKKDVILQFHDEEAVIDSEGKVLATYKTRKCGGKETRVLLIK